MNTFTNIVNSLEILSSNRSCTYSVCYKIDSNGNAKILFLSVGYTTRDVLYRWNAARRVAIAEDMKLSQFDLITTPTANQTDALKSGRGRAAAVNVLKGASNEVSSNDNRVFHARGKFPPAETYGKLPHPSLRPLRSTGGAVVGFLLAQQRSNRRQSITTVLTMTFLGLEARTDLPKVPYPTALDFFVFLSFAFIFATIIQFAVVHYFTKYGSGEVYFSSDLSTSGESSSEGEWEEGEGERSVSAGGGSGSGRKLSGSSTPSGDANGRGDITRLEVIPLAPPSIYFHDRRSLFAQTQRHHRRFAADGRFQNRVIATPPSVVLVPPQQGDAIGRRMRKCMGAERSLRDRAAPIRDHPASIGRYDVPPGQSPTPGAAQLSPLPHMQQPLRRRLSDSIRERFHRRESAVSAAAARGTKRRKKRTPRYNSVSKIDRASRVVFPLCFLAINLFYWYNYLSRSERMNSHAPRL
ncbi:hypothetical protein J437_LFUL000021 [Ladona fulva]|uniref:Neurotransmitter-gated ion-channel transmembrane domain-containing protein n=1 Tax=Ladona fulva TaxID=123851 RepID=A0A8K0K308_LADFU|nr:hypothetical protein J437_LFUL000021 [Ladona fulva]